MAVVGTVCMKFGGLNICAFCSDHVHSRISVFHTEKIVHALPSIWDVHLGVHILGHSSARGYSCCFVSDS